MDTPLFSIVIANYNYGRFLEEAIESVIAQNMGNQVELIICDASSTDNSVEIIKKYAGGLPPNTSRSEWTDPNSKLQTPNSKLITWWCSEKDGGQSAAFNKGFSHASGRFLTWLNADDILLPGALIGVEKEILTHPECEWFIGSSMYVDKDLRVMKCFRSHRFSRIRSRYGFLSVGGPSSFFTKDLLEAVGGVDESLHFLMDIDLWYKFARIRKCKYRRTKAYVFAYRIHEESKMSGADVIQTEKTSKNRKLAKAELELIRERYDMPTNRIIKVATICTLSVVDKIISILHTIQKSGRRVIYA